MATSYQSPAQLHEAGVVFLRAQRMNEAIGALREAHLLAPESCAYQHDLAVALSLNGQVELAIAELKALLTRRPDYADAHANLGLLLLQSGKAEDALGPLRRCAELRPLSAQAHHHVATALKLLGRWQEAIAAYRKALSFKPDFKEARRSLERLAKEHGEPAPPLTSPASTIPATEDEYRQAMHFVAHNQLADAVRAFQIVLQKNPCNFDAWHNLGVVLLKSKQEQDAEKALRRALELNPNSAEAHNSMGLLQLQRRQNAEAIHRFRQAVALKPDVSEFHANLGTALLHRKQLDEAIASLLAACKIRKSPETLRSLGSAHRAKKQFEAAHAVLQEALELKPNAPEVLQELGLTHVRMGQLEDAVRAFREALRYRADYIDAWNNLAVVLADLDRLPEAIAALEECLRYHPEHAETHRNLALILLAAGDFERGFREYEWRWQCAHAGRRQFAQPFWDGSPLEGRTILLYCEQGLGDTLQFIRYAPLVRERGGRVIVECQKPLVALLSRAAGIDVLVERGAPLPEFDVQAPLMSLPLLLKTTVQTTPGPAAYLHVDSELVKYWRGFLGRWHGFKIAVAWQGNPKYGGDAQRSISLEHFADLGTIPGVCLVSLQKTHGLDQIETLKQRIPLLDLDRQIDQAGGAFVDSAAILKSVDLVVTSDSAIAHLAGAVGARAWLALPTSCDWRWFRGGESTPWYPSMRLFRQTRRGDWSFVFAQIASEVRRLVDTRSGESELLAPTSPGELLDKVSILEIKLDRIADPKKRVNLQFELDRLVQIRARALPADGAWRAMAAELKTVNESLWEIEDALRECERARSFDARFTELARSVYHQNDRRAALKKKINTLLRSAIVEEKSYAGSE